MSSLRGTILFLQYIFFKDELWIPRKHVNMWIGEGRCEENIRWSCSKYINFLISDNNLARFIISFYIFFIWMCKRGLKRSLCNSSANSRTKGTACGNESAENSRKEKSISNESLIRVLHNKHYLLIIRNFSCCYLTFLWWNTRTYGRTYSVYRIRAFYTKMLERNSILFGLFTYNSWCAWYVHTHEHTVFTFTLSTHNKFSHRLLFFLFFFFFGARLSAIFAIHPAIHQLP